MILLLPGIVPQYRAIKLYGGQGARSLVLFCVPAIDASLLPTVCTCDQANGKDEQRPSYLLLKYGRLLPEIRFGLEPLVVQTRESQNSQNRWPH